MRIGSVWLALAGAFALSGYLADVPAPTASAGNKRWSDIHQVGRNETRGASPLKAARGIDDLDEAVRISLARFMVHSERFDRCMALAG
jgi:hypothetical protein